MKTIWIFLGILLLAALGWYFYNNNKLIGQGEGESSTEEKRKKLILWADASKTDSAAGKEKAKTAIMKMNPDEIQSVYKFIFEHVVPGRKLTNEKLKSEINAISSKYNIFT